MRIGLNDSYFQVERVGQEGLSVIWRIEAALRGIGWNFTAVHDQVKVDAGGDASSQLADFAAHRVGRFQMMLLEEGWLRVRRDPAGGLLVRYRVGQASTGAALEGEVFLTGKAAKAFCGELGQLLRLE